MLPFPIRSESIISCQSRAPAPRPQRAVRRCVMLSSECMPLIESPASASEKPNAEQREDSLEPVYPRDSLAFLHAARVIRNRDLDDPMPVPSEESRDFGFEVEECRLSLRSGATRRRVEKLANRIGIGVPRWGWSDAT